MDFEETKTHHSQEQSKYWERTHKFGIRIPKNVKEAMQIDKENGNTMWMDAMKKEMGNVRVAFEEHNGNPNELVGYQKIECHMIFDIKLSENSRRKASWIKWFRYPFWGHPECLPHGTNP